MAGLRNLTVLVLIFCASALWSQDRSSSEQKTSPLNKSILFNKGSYSHGLQVNPAEWGIYDEILLEGQRSFFPTGNFPLNYGYLYKTETLKNTEIEAEVPVEPVPLNKRIIDYRLVRSLSAAVYGSSRHGVILPGESGTRLYKGINFLFTEDAYFSYHKNKHTTPLSWCEGFVVYLQMKQHFTQEGVAWDAGIPYRGFSKSMINRFYLKWKFFKSSITAGLDNVKLGPGQYGLVLSQNSAAYPMIRLQSEESIEFFGHWDFFFMSAWLTEERDDWDQPFLLAARGQYRFRDWFQVGVTRTVLFGGYGDGPQLENRGYYMPWDAFRLIFGPNDDEVGGRYDNLGMFAVDAAVYPRVDLLLPVIKSCKVYYQYAFQDLVAPWFDSGPDQLRIFHFVPAVQYGILVTTRQQIFRLEYAGISRYFYLHHEYYDEGYSYRDMSLGYPWGRNSQSVLLRHVYKFSNLWSLESMIGKVIQPAFESGASSLAAYHNIFALLYKKDIFQSQRYFFRFRPVFRWRGFEFTGFLQVDILDGWDDDDAPHQYIVWEDVKVGFAAGAGCLWRL